MPEAEGAVVLTGLNGEAARLEFGRLLVEHREKKGLSRADVVRLTRVPALLIGAMEDGEHEKWPERVFVVNALRSYATVVGVDAAELLTRFDRLQEAPRAEAFDPRSLEAKRRSGAITMVWVSAAVLAVAGLAVALRSTWEVAARVSRSAR